jgi:hypothetical protein
MLVTVITGLALRLATASIALCSAGVRLSTGATHRDEIVE